MTRHERTALLAEQRRRDTTTTTTTTVQLEGVEDPKNWPVSRKWFCAILVSLYALMGPVSSAMVVPALPSIARDLSITSEPFTQAIVSVFVLGWCLGPLFVAPCSEIFGRAAVLNAGHFLFLMANTACAVASNRYAFLILRFVSGFLGSAPLALGGGTMSDLWISDERGKSLAVYTVAPLLGPAIGPIGGGILVRHVSWRWIFYAVSVFTALSLVVGMFALDETFAPVLVKRKRHAMQARLEEEEEEAERMKGDVSQSFNALVHKLFREDLKRPFILLFTQPIVQALALYMAYLFGLNYLTISTFQRLFLDKYHEGPDVASLNYISIALGFVLGCQVAAPLNDKVYASLKQRNGGVGAPEFRTYLMVPASIMVPAGLLLYGWTAEYRLHWMLPNLGIAVYCFGLIVSYQCIHAYTLDCYPTFAASAIGSLSVMRCMGGFAFPMFGPALYRTFGYGGGSTLLAGVALVLGGVGPWLLKTKGPAWREKSEYAAGHVAVTL